MAHIAQETDTPRSSYPSMDGPAPTGDSFQWVEAYATEELKIEIGSSLEGKGLMMRTIEAKAAKKWEGMIHSRFYQNLQLVESLPPQTLINKIKGRMARGEVILADHTTGDKQIKISYMDPDSGRLTAILLLPSVPFTKDDVITLLKLKLDQMLEIRSTNEYLEEEVKEKDAEIDELRLERDQYKKQYDELKDETKEETKSDEVVMDDRSKKIMGDLTVDQLVRDDHPSVLNKLAKQNSWDKAKEKDEDGNVMFLVLLWDVSYAPEDPLRILHAKYMYINRSSEVKPDEKYKSFNALELCAMEPKLIEMLQWLLKDGKIDPNVDHGGPLYWAASYGDILAASVLLQDSKVNKDHTGPFGNTPLMIAVKNEHKDMVSYLLESGCDTKIKNKKEMTAMGLARQGGNSEVIALLRSVGAT